MKKECIKKTLAFAVAAAMTASAAPVFAAQTQAELNGTPIESFSDSFDDYNLQLNGSKTYQASQPSRFTANRFRAVSDIDQTTHKTKYQGNAADNITVATSTSYQGFKESDDVQKYPLGVADYSATKESLAAEGYTVYDAAGASEKGYFWGYKDNGDGSYKAKYNNNTLTAIGGLDGYWGWYGRKLFEGYPGKEFNNPTQSQVVNAKSEKRLAVMYEDDNNYVSNGRVDADGNPINKFLMFDTRPTMAGNATATFGKHNLDFGKSKEIKFRVYPYMVVDGGASFSFSLTKGDYNMAWSPSFKWTTNYSKSEEMYREADFTGKMFNTDDDSELEVLKLTGWDPSGDNGEGSGHRIVIGGENDTGRKYNTMSEDGYLGPATYKWDGTGDAAIPLGSKAPLWYDFDIKVTRIRSDWHTISVSCVKNAGSDTEETLFENEVFDDFDFLGDSDTKYGIMFKAVGPTNTDGGTVYRTKVALDNLSFGNVQTAEEKYEITEHGYNNDKYACSVTGKTGTSAVVFAAEYNLANQLESIDFKNITFDEADKNVTFDNFAPSAENTVKVYLWNSADGMVPLCSAK